MRNEELAALFVGFFIGFALSGVIIGSIAFSNGSNKATLRMQNEAVERGYGELVVEKGERMFRWKDQ